MSYLNDYLYIDDEVKFRVYVEIDATGSSVSELHVQKPDGTTSVWTATVADINYLEYTTQNGDLDQEGFYQLHAYIEKGTTKKLGNTVEFTVKEKYE